MQDFVVPQLSWGSRPCLLFKREEEYFDFATAYFKAGLERNERCVLVVLEPFTTELVESAISSLGVAAGSAQNKRQIKLLDCRATFQGWSALSFDKRAFFQAKLERDALDAGFAGVRCSVNCPPGTDWPTYLAWGEFFAEWAREHNVMSLFGVSLDHCRPDDLVGIIEHHELAFVHQDGRWKTIVCPKGRSMPPFSKDRDGDNAEQTERLAREIESLRRTIKDKDLLLRELHHRVKNNLQALSSLLLMKAQQKQNPALREAIDDLLAQISAITLVNESLADMKDQGQRVDVGHYLASLAGAITRAHMVRERIDVRTDVAATHLDPGRALLLGLIVAEGLTNAIKHAFPSGRRGSVSIHFEQTREKNVLNISDDGIGLAQDIAPVEGAGTGLMTELSRQLAGTLTWTRAKGTRVTLIFPR